MERGEFRTAAAAGLTYGAGTQAVVKDSLHLLYTATRIGGGDGHAEQPAESHDARSVEAQLATRLHSDVSRSARVVLVAAFPERRLQ